MTGPAYPRPPAPGSNGIGLAAIGIAQIGTIPPFDYWTTIISQYANSPRLMTLIDNFNSYIDQTANLDMFFDNVQNIATAQGYGLDCWGRIVGVVRNLNVQVTGWFGFAEATPGSETFGQGAFYSGAPLTSTYALSDDAFRTLIFAKALANISDGSIPSINKILMSLFPGRGNCYVTDGVYAGSFFGFAEAQNEQPFNQAPFYSGQTIRTMAIQYVFTFALSPVELAIVQQSGVLPKPCGVAASTLIL